MPLINKCRGGGGGASQLCEQVDNFLVTTGILSATITWAAPSNDENGSFVGTKIVRKVDACPTSPSDGVTVYEGTDFTYTDEGLTEGVTYYYRAFAYNSEGKYQTSMRYGSITAVNIPESFVLASWEQIITACQANAVPDTWAVGDSKDMTIDGVSYTIDIIGKNHDTYSDGSGIAPLTFQLHDCYGTMYQMESSNTTANGWEGCAMRKTHLPAILALMPAAIKTAIKNVNKLTSAGNGSTTIKTSADGLFLLSEVEIFGSTISTSYSVAGEGSQYEYYSAGNSKVKNSSGYARFWWERSPSTKNSTSRFCLVSYTGNVGAGNASTTNGVAFAFCF